jgi:hypothetical protein
MDIFLLLLEGAGGGENEKEGSFFANSGLLKQHCFISYYTLH